MGRNLTARPLDLRIVDDYDALSDLAAEIFVAVVGARHRAVVGLPTGRTPLGLYRRLALLRRSGFDFSGLKVVCLDEYLGVGPESPISLFAWLHRAVIGPLGIGQGRVLRLPSDDREPSLACAGFDRRLDREGRLDLVVLGLGWNGHVGFNEPGSPPSARTRIVALDPGTRERNRRYWAGRSDIPAYGMTIGLRDIIRAGHILLLVSGRNKARILKASLRGPVTPRVPASLLRRGRLTVLADRPAATLLPRTDQRA